MKIKESKLEIITASLNRAFEKRKILITDKDNSSFLDVKNTGLGDVERYYFRIAPLTATFDISKLNGIMMSLVTQLKPDRVERFRVNKSKDTLYYGELHFREQIGTLKTSITLNPGVAIRISTFSDSFSSRLYLRREGYDGEIPLNREITIAMYPSILIAAEDLRREMGSRICGINLSQIRKYQ